jgi:hypothetical protein
MENLARVTMLLRNVVYISYLVPVSRVRPFVPKIIKPAIVEEDRIFVSVVLLQCMNVRLAYLPFPRFHYNQVNVRTYVIDPYTSNQGVYFLKSCVTSSFISLLTGVLGPSWEKGDFHYQALLNEKTGLHAYNASGNWHGELTLEAEETGIEPEDLSPFIDTESAINYLLRPLIGFYGKQGYVGRFEIGHPHLKPFTIQVHNFSCELLQTMDLIRKEEIGKPHSTLLVSESNFDIYLPPRRIAIDRRQGSERTKSNE